MASVVVPFTSTHGAPSGPFARLKLSSTPAVGKPAGVTMICTVSRPIAVVTSVTVSTALYVPAAAYVCTGFASDEPDASPKFHE